MKEELKRALKTAAKSFDKNKPVMLVFHDDADGIIPTGKEQELIQKMEQIIGGRKLTSFM